MLGSDFQRMKMWWQYWIGDYHKAHTILSVMCTRVCERRKWKSEMEEKNQFDKIWKLAVGAHVASHGETKKEENF